MNWWFEDPKRAQLEINAISELYKKSEWLTQADSRLNGHNLYYDITIKIDNIEHTLILEYPEFFPDTPPSIKPRTEVRLSPHQWGKGGELCLEHRPDNWQSEITGAELIESAHKLLQSEASDPVPVPSEHNLSLGQEVRNDTYRFLVSANLLAVIQELKVGAISPALVCELKHAGTTVARLKSIGEEPEPIWDEPLHIKNGWAEKTANIIRLADETHPSNITEVGKLRDILEKNDHLEWADRKNIWEYSFLILASHSRVMCYVLFVHNGIRYILPYTSIYLPENAERQLQSYTSLTFKRVALVGCGSVGSKIAISLARAGIGNFVLIDSDIFFEDNIVRNGLDLRATGISKASALQAALLEVNPECEIEVRRISLGAQESATSTSLAVKQLKECDAVVDATADPAAFTLCAAACIRGHTPLFWTQIWAGGIGGFVARSRPKLDPPPLDARSQVEAWIHEQGVKWDGQSSSRKYGLETDDDTSPLVADDSEVSVIAAHATRFVLDWLTNQEQSIFSSSAYAIGLRAKWIFRAPFEVWPIDLVEAGSWERAELSEEDRHTLTSLVVQLISGGQQENEA